jgi:hypothetical protein
MGGESGVKASEVSSSGLVTRSELKEQKFGAPGRTLPVRALQANQPEAVIENEDELPQQRHA